jgi:hypothetical protein
VTRIGLPKRASYNPTNAGVNIASNTLTCFSAHLGLLPQAGMDIEHRVIAEQLLLKNAPDDTLLD